MVVLARGFTAYALERGGEANTMPSVCYSKPVAASRVWRHHWGALAMAARHRSAFDRLRLSGRRHIRCLPAHGELVEPERESGDILAGFGMTKPVENTNLYPALTLLLPNDTLSANRYYGFHTIPVDGVVVEALLCRIIGVSWHSGCHWRSH